MFPVDDIALLPETYEGVRNNFGGLHSLDGIIWHTSEGAGFSRTDAVNTRNWQVYNPGSYNWLAYDKLSAGAKGGALLTIPYLEACGGLNPHTDAWAPERYPWLKQALNKPCPVQGCAGAYYNPTMHHAQIAISGKRLAVDRGQMPANMTETLLALVKFLEAKANKALVQSGHMHWQTNRSDPGIIFLTLRAGSGVVTLPDTSTEDTELFKLIRPLRNKKAVVPAGIKIFSEPNFNAGSFTKETNVTVYPFAEVEGTVYKTGADTTDIAWVAYITNRNTYKFIPKINVRLSDVKLALPAEVVELAKTNARTGVQLRDQLLEV